MGFLKKITGYKVERIPDISFRLMSFVFTLRDILFPVGKRLERFGIKKGFSVIDFGCGPGSYVEHAAKLVGASGHVYAVDVHPLAIKAVMKKIKKKQLQNVIPVLSTGFPIDIESHSADVIYALDMFHHINDAQSFLTELRRLLKTDGTLYIESGHQKIAEARDKIVRSGCWRIKEENRSMFECRPAGM